MVILQITMATTFAAILVGATTVLAQVTLLPGTQTGSPGQIVEFAFGYEGDGRVVSRASFDIVYPLDAPYLPINNGGVVACAIEAGANADVGVHPVFDPFHNTFRVAFGDLSNPIQPIGKSGIILRCLVQIKEHATLGEYALACREGSAQANSNEGFDLAATCPDGVLNVVAPPTATATPPEPTATRVPGVCCQYAGTPDLCGLPLSGSSCAPGVAVSSASCSSSGHCLTFTPSPTTTATHTPGPNDCCERRDGGACGPPVNGSCGENPVVHGAACGSNGECVTITPSPTEGLMPTSTPTPAATPPTSPTCSPTATASPAVSVPCIGDCNHDDAVEINELILGVNIALGTQPVPTCLTLASHNGRVDIVQLVRAVNNALQGCTTPGA